MNFYAGVELGGTKTVCAAATADGQLLERIRLDTRLPEETLPAIHDALGGLAERHGSLAGLGIGSFGPINLNPQSPHYGQIGSTPKKDWRGRDILGYFRERFDVPVALDTDVTAAAFGEARWGAARGADSVVYITVGTGVGAGAILHGRAIHGLMHPEAGHIRVPRAAGDDYPGGCPHHDDCVEGMAAGPSIVARWGCRLGDLPEDHVAYEQTAHYLAHLVVNWILLVSPQKIVIGGGVLSNENLYPMIRVKVRSLLNDYVTVPELDRGIDDFIVKPGLADDAGVIGAASMAAAALRQQTVT